MRRVVVTGLGLVTPLGCGVERVWRRLIRGESGIRRITRFEVDDLPAKIAGQVPTEGEGAFRTEEVLEPKDVRKNDPFILYGIAAAREAVEDAGWTPQDERERERTGVLIGSGIGGLSTIADTAVELERRGPRRVSPFFIPASLINLVSGQVSIRFGFKGPNHAVVTACSTGAHAIGDASRMIALGDADVMVAGGAEAAICRIGVAGFAAARALSTRFNDTPRARLATLGRGPRRLRHGRGCRASWCSRSSSTPAPAVPGSTPRWSATASRATPITSPRRARTAMAAFARCRPRCGAPACSPRISTTSTRTAPRPRSATRSSSARSSGCSAMPPTALSMSSTKSAIGHLLGAAGSVEAIFSLLAVHHQIVPPTLNLDRPSPGCDLDLVPHEARRREVRAALSNSFGFGGTNASLILVRPPEH